MEAHPCRRSSSFELHCREFLSKWSAFGDVDHLTVELGLLLSQWQQLTAGCWEVGGVRERVFQKILLEQNVNARTSESHNCFEVLAA